MPEVKGKKYPYTPEGVAAAEEAKRSTFTLKSGNSPLFKMLGSSPVKGLTKGSGTHGDHHLEKEGKGKIERELAEEYGPMPL